MNPKTGLGLIAAGAVLVVGGLIGGFVFAEDAETTDETATTSTTSTASTTEATTSTTVDRATLIDRDDVEAFYDVFVGAVNTDDAETLLDRLHPVVFEVFGEEQCRGFVEPRFNNPELTMDVVDVGPLETWQWVMDDRTVDVPEAVTVSLLQVEETGGPPTALEVHLALDGDEVAWFTDCGDPI